MDMQEMLKNEDTMQRFADAIAARMKHPCRFTEEDIAFIRAGSAWHVLLTNTWRGAIAKAVVMFAIVSLIGGAVVNIYDFARGGNGNGNGQTEAR